MAHELRRHHGAERCDGCRVRFDQIANGPDEAKELARDHGGHRQRHFPFLREASIARAESVLRFRREGDHGGRLSVLSCAERRTGRVRAVPIGPRGLDQDASQMRIPRFRDGAAAHRGPARMLSGDQSRVGHELACGREPAQRPQLTHKSGGRQLLNAAQRGQGTDQGLLRRCEGCQRGIDCAFEPCDPIGKHAECGAVLIVDDL